MCKLLDDPDPCFLVLAGGDILLTLLVIMTAAYCQATFQPWTIFLLDAYEPFLKEKMFVTSDK